MRPIAEIRREVRAEWPRILQRAGTRRATFPAAPNILGSGVKTEKGRARGILTAVAYMSPDSEAFPRGDGRTLCPFASAECSALCLGHSTGRLAMAPAENARIWKTTLYLGARALWRELLRAECEAHARAAARIGYVPAIRIDGSSDTGEGALLAPALGGVRFYDYTKSEARALKHARGEYPPNYHVTYSYSGRNAPECRRVLAAGGNVAAVFDADPRTHAPLPPQWWGSRVVDGDADDARFLDPREVPGVIVGLRFKQARQRAAALERAGRFVIRRGQATCWPR